MGEPLLVQAEIVGLVEEVRVQAAELLVRWLLRRSCLRRRTAPKLLRWTQLQTCLLHRGDCMRPCRW